MRRSLQTAALTLLLVPALTGLPVTTASAAQAPAGEGGVTPGATSGVDGTTAAPAATPAETPATVPAVTARAAVPVAPRVTTLALAGVDRAALTADARRTLQEDPASVFRSLSTTATGGTPSVPAVMTAERDAARFDLAAVTWDARRTASGSSDEPVRVLVRVREGSTWTDWETLEADADGPDAGTAEERRSRAVGTSEPLVTAGADGVQVRVDTASGRAPEGLRLRLVDGGRSTADAEPDRAALAAGTDPGAPGADRTAMAARATRPAIVSRTGWGADERLVGGGLDVNPRVRALVLHHTATTSSYSPSQAYAQMRSVYAFHTKVRGWSDIGYNFVVDRHGRVFEGRRGSISKAVRGAHAGGFNAETVGVSVLGTYSTSAPPAAAMRAVTDVLAWQAARWFVDPRGTTVLTSAGGGTSRYAAGRAVRLPTVMGHRSVGQTECPGNALFPRLASIRSSITPRLVPGLGGTAVSARTAVWAGTPLTVTGTVPIPQRWTLTVTSACSTAPVRTITGTAEPRISAAWNLRGDAGAPVAPGLYTLTLVTRSPVRAVPARSWQVEVLPPPLPVTPGAALPAPAASRCPVQRVSGGSAGATAVQLGRRVQPASTSLVLVGGRSTDDAVVAAPLARAKGAPLLFSGNAGLPEVVVQDVRRRRVTTAWVVGSPTAVQDGVLQQLRTLGVTVTRLAGADRDATAAVVAAEISATATAAGLPAPSAAVLLTAGTAVSSSTGSPTGSPVGSDVVTAASGASLAAATGRPVLWVGRAGVPAATSAALRAGSITAATVVAPESAVPQSVLAALGRSGVRAVRVTAPDGAGLSAATATATGAASAADVVVASASAPAAELLAAAATGRPLLVTSRFALPAAASRWLAPRSPRSVTVVGGPGSTDSAVLRALEGTVR